MKINKILTALIAAACIIFTSSAQISQSDDISANYGFGEMEIIKLDWGIAAMSIADLNNDGRNDIIVINNLRSRIEVLIQKEQIGPTETFVSVDPRDIDINVLEPPSRFEKQPIAVSQRMYSLVCGDLNSDSLIDLAYYGEPKGLYVLLQKDQDSQEKPDGKLSWHTRKRIAIDDGLQTPYALVCADLNGDGLADLALAARDAIYLVLQKKDGTLSEPIKYPSTATIRAIDAADINGDGINDLIMVVSDIEKPIHVRFGLPDGQL
ncbi:MAG: FG-GAP-like repeat-containing protein, partial [Phycisphaerae bacterium]